MSDFMQHSGGAFHAAAAGGAAAGTVGMPMILAQAKTAAPSTTGAPGSPQPAPGPGNLLDNPIIYIILIFAVFWIFSIRSSRQKSKQKQTMLDNMKRGDRVQTIGGILGTIVEARDKEIIVKVDESSNTKIKFARGAIDRIVDEEKA